jgi:hypothetical protein
MKQTFMVEIFHHVAVSTQEASGFDVWNAKVKTPWTTNIHFKKKERQEGKIGFFWEWVPVGGGKAWGKGEWGWIWWIYFVFMKIEEWNLLKLF